MDAIDLLRYQVRDTYAWLEMTVSNVSQEQANWQPPGTANSIGAVYAHTMIAADVGFNSQLHGGMPIMATEFAGQVGLSEMHLGGFDWHEWASRLHVDWEALREYGRAVHKCVEGYLASLMMYDLERSADMSAQGSHLGIWTGLEFYNVHGVAHPRLHGGEIACLKGLQGALGWQQGWSSGLKRPV